MTETPAGRPKCAIYGIGLTLAELIRQGLDPGLAVALIDDFELTIGDFATAGVDAADLGQLSEVLA